MWSQRQRNFTMNCVNIGLLELNIRLLQCSSWAVSMGVIFDTREHGSWTRVLCTDYHIIRHFITPLHVIRKMYNRNVAHRHRESRQSNKRQRIFEYGKQHANSYSIFDFFRILPLQVAALVPADTGQIVRRRINALRCPSYCRVSTVPSRTSHKSD